MKRVASILAGTLLLGGASSLIAATVRAPSASAQPDTTWQWGRSTYNQQRNIMEPKVKDHLFDVVQIDSSNNENIVLLSNGTVFDWGNDEFGDLGNGTDNVPSGVPVQVLGVRDVTTVASGYDYGLALTSGGHVWAWGFDEKGDLCNGSTDHYFATPFEIPGVAGVKGIAAGGGTTVLLLDGGTVETCGSNGYGQLGDGTTGGLSSTPVGVKGLGDVIAVSGADDYEAALTGGGTVYGWGANNLGQLGDGSTVNASTPVEALGITNAEQIYAGGDTYGNGQMMVEESSHNVVGYGDGVDGQLCNGSFSSSDKPTPVTVPSGVTFVEVASGGAFSIFLDSKGGVWTCGYDNYGQLGDGTAGVNTDLPGKVDSGADMISTTGNHAMDHHP